MPFTFIYILMEKVYYPRIAPLPWDQRRLSEDDIKMTCPWTDQGPAPFTVPSIRPMVDEHLSRQIRQIHQSDPADVLYALDMELRHIFQKVEARLYSKKKKRAPYEK